MAIVRGIGRPVPVFTGVHLPKGVRLDAGLRSTVRAPSRKLAIGLATILMAWGGAVGAVEPGQAAPAAAFEPLGLGAPSPLPSLAKGRVTYVDFWASWCVPCRTSMPALDALYRRYRDRGLDVIGVNKDERRDDAIRFLARVRVDFPLSADPDDRLAHAYGVKAMPSGYLVDRGGRVRFVHRGFTAETAAALEEQVTLLLGEAR